MQRLKNILNLTASIAMIYVVIKKKRRKKGSLFENGTLVGRTLPPNNEALYENMK
jgi:hypothetical protein